MSWMTCTHDMYPRYIKCYPRYQYMHPRHQKRSPRHVPTIWHPRYIKCYPRYQNMHPRHQKCSPRHVPTICDINQTIVNSRKPRFTYNFSAAHVVGNMIDVVGNMYPRYAPTISQYAPTISQHAPTTRTHDMHPTISQYAPTTSIQVYPRYHIVVHDIIMLPTTSRHAHISWYMSWGTFLMSWGTCTPRHQKRSP